MSDHRQSVPFNASNDFMTSDEVFSTLSPSEIAWRDRQEFFQSCGYMLRPRYCPGWTPSWRGTGKHPRHFEDSRRLPVRPELVDATRISDGSLVYIKRVGTGDRESWIASTLSAIDDPLNHCVPILEIIQDSDDETISYMVMPFLRLMDDPPFDAIGEVLDFVDQIFDGLVFLHKHGIAHRDCVQKNIMMDASAMYPQGFHPVDLDFLPDNQNWAWPLPRTVAPVKYYFVDFGISSWFPSEAHPRLVLGMDGRDQEVPELSDDIPYDPFKVDIFIIGNMFREEFFQKYSNLNFLVPMITVMTHPDPTMRPDAPEVLRRWRAIRQRISFLHRCWRPWPRDESMSIRAVMDTFSLAQRGYHLSKQLVTGR